MKRRHEIDEALLEKIHGGGGIAELSLGDPDPPPPEPPFPPDPPGGGNNQPEPWGNDGPGFQEYDEGSDVG